MDEVVYYTVFFVLILLLVWIYKRYKATQQQYNEQLALTAKMSKEMAELSTRATSIKLQDVHIANFLQQAVQGVILLGADQTIVYANTHAEKLLGIFLPDLVKKPYKNSLTFKKGDAVDYSTVEKAFQGETVAIADLTLKSRTGQIFVAGTASPVKDDAGKVTGVLLIVWDATEEKKKEDEFKSFVSTAAHDIRTPLAIIKSGVALVTEQFDKLEPAKVKETLESVTPSVAHLESLVNNFLTASRIEQGRLAVHKEPFDLTSLTRDVVATLEPTVRSKNLFMTYVNEGAVIPKVLGDTVKTKEILVNLLGNALKYTQQGGVTISHETREGKVFTKVVDSGVGIPDEYKRLLFRKFSQVGEAVHASVSQSSGLGLFIAQKLARLQGGDLELESSEPTKGSTFVFWLPQASKA